MSDFIAYVYRDQFNLSLFKHGMYIPLPLQKSVKVQMTLVRKNRFKFLLIFEFVLSNCFPHLWV